MGFWKKHYRCVAAVVGGVPLGVLTGAGGGSVLPFVGTVAGAWIGGLGAALAAIPVCKGG